MRPVITDQVETGFVSDGSRECSGSGNRRAEAIITLSQNYRAGSRIDHLANAAVAVGQEQARLRSRDLIVRVMGDLRLADRRQARAENKARQENRRASRTVRPLFHDLGITPTAQRRRSNSALMRR